MGLQTVVYDCQVADSGFELHELAPGCIWSGALIWFGSGAEELAFLWAQRRWAVRKGFKQIEDRNKE